MIAHFLGVALTFLLISSQAFATLPEPFWNKPALLKKLKEDREVLVSVTTDSLPETAKDQAKRVRFNMSGVGYVRKAKEHCFKLAQEYPRLKEVSDHFKQLEWDAKKSELFIVTEALGYQARMIMKMTPVSEATRDAIQFEVIWGQFRGMKGEIDFDTIDASTTQESLRATYESSSLPLPKILMGFALEVIVQKVAEKMRTYIETHEPTALAVPPAITVSPPPVLPAPAEKLKGNQPATFR
jgi:hypothetical protein